VANELLRTMDIALIISKLLSFGILLGALIIKIPQIITIRTKKSVKGLQLSSYWMETVGYTITFSYNFNSGFVFSTYGETAFILVQNIIIIYLIYSYQRKINQNFFLALLAYGVFLVVFVTGLPGLKTLSFFQSLTIPLFTVSKIPQIWNNFQKKSIGALSFLTVFMQFGGSAARIFTTIKEVSDPIILIGFITGTVLNGILTAQCLLYPADTASDTARVKAKAQGSPRKVK